jgi:Mn2+/Fe2+ NRAMP family transporter
LALSVLWLTSIRELCEVSDAVLLILSGFLQSGSWGVDLQAGSQYGYRLLFVVLLAGIFAVVLQVGILLMSRQ